MFMYVALTLLSEEWPSSQPLDFWVASTMYSDIFTMVDG